MATLSDIKIKELGATGAVTTDGVAGILSYVFASGTKAGDKVEIKDGATTRITMLIPADNGSVKFEPPKDERPKFTTDIDCAITETTGAVTATFIYREII